MKTLALKFRKLIYNVLTLQWSGEALPDYKLPVCFLLIKAKQSKTSSS